MRNLELKARLADIGRGEAAARAIGASYAGDLYQLDTYFDVATGRLKLRETGGESAELVFYDRPEDAPTRWSEYFKGLVAEPAAVRGILARALGVKVQVEKTRRLYLFRGARIHLDRVSDLGTFLEFEVPAEGDAAAAARATMSELMEAFGVGDADAIAASYGELLSGAAAPPLAGGGPTI